MIFVLHNVLQYMYIGREPIEQLESFSNIIGLGTLLQLKINKVLVFWLCYPPRPKTCYSGPALEEGEVSGSKEKRFQGIPFGRPRVWGAGLDL